ncbi:MAG: hypothetical protein JWR17_991, partial [Pseudomonas sp.]|nr:hypothetical protein [Pseudomonas sp.]
MLSKLFRRKQNSTPPAINPDIKNNRPRVGETRRNGAEETLYLAPLPVFTGQQAVSTQNFSEMNEVYLQMGGNNNGMVMQGKLLAWVIWLILIAMFGLPLILATYIITFSPPHIERFFWELLGMGIQANFGVILFSG